MSEKCENCKEDIIPVKKETVCYDEPIIDYQCPNCGYVLRTVIR